MPEVKSNGITFHVQHLRNGDKTVVFVHGLVMDNLSSWYYTLANSVAQHAEVFLYDLRGHGRSERPATGYTIDDQVQDLYCLLETLGVTRPVYLAGNSFGGVIALAFAVAHPERVAGLILIEAHVAVEGWGEVMAGGLNLAGLLLDDADVQEWLDIQGGRKLNRMARNAEALIWNSSLVEDLRDAPQFHESDLRRITCPTLAIYGEHSDVLDRAHELAQLLPNCELKVFPHRTHSVIMEATPEVRAEVLAWLAHQAPAHPDALRATDNTAGED
ncbi:MAG: alpha/beta hydrolase [Actinomycetota bacterium]|jgi:pimeloyl-ACP methyl ester carboxylesterase|nr:alpha/beta hydrolase [Actinomycetota bacterium]